MKRVEKTQSFLLPNILTNIHAAELSMDNIKIPSKQTRLLREIQEKLKGTFLLQHKVHQQSILAYTLWQSSWLQESKRTAKFLNVIRILISTSFFYYMSNI